MQSSTSSVAQPEAILEWLQKEMGYRPLGPYASSSTKAAAFTPTADSIRTICRGNMIPIWNFLLKRVKSEKTVDNIRRNILVHGGSSGGVENAAVVTGDTGRGSTSRGTTATTSTSTTAPRRRKEKQVNVVGKDNSVSGLERENSRDIALQERDLAEKEVERLRQIVRRQRKELKARMLEVSREEAERKRMLDERSNYRHKQVMLEAHDQQCDEATKIFAEYHKRLRYYVNQARDVQRSSIDPVEVVTSIQPKNEKEAVYSTVKGSKSVDNVILIETNWERNIRRACEYLGAQVAERICTSFPAYEGTGIHLNPQTDIAKLGIDIDGVIADEVRAVIGSCLKNPPQLLQAITTYTQRLKTVISKEIEKIDVRADAETLRLSCCTYCPLLEDPFNWFQVIVQPFLSYVHFHFRYKYENDRVMDTSSADVSSPLQYQLYGNRKLGVDAFSRGSQNQLLERQKAHVQQFVATEESLNKAAEARNMSQQLLKRLHGTGGEVSSQSIVSNATSQNMSSLRQLELEVWAKEREAAGLRASLSTLMSEIQRLNTLCEERKEAEDSLKKKWKKIEEFDARRSELESIYTALLKANTDAAAFWRQQPLASREYASSTIIPACNVVLDISNKAKDLIEREVSAFYNTPDNGLYMLPSTPQALLEALSASGSTGPEAVAAAEKNAAILTARAGARDPSAIPSICRISAALQYPAGLDNSDASLASVLESMEFCLKLRGSEACVLEELANAINLVHIRRDLVESGHALLNHAHRVQQEYERYNLS
ncbi:OLC1v1009835C1 [Oldenlandia corymbosa var. corymbosa]|uniref:OLC1v1009835C1 n=1 Tax=Oldenlandia corymbosa var. corymbosa TaxID=529605 RepID=A0AAV1DPV0_OLDCO|nr:OLC1v1009835C1 [Oldenlandia corymbosa var. corymbosa]